MPIAEFPGNNSWGYNPTDMYSPESAYGGPLELQKFVDACHARKMAVYLDVVHNHWGPSELSTWQFDGYAPGAAYGGIYHYNTDGLCDTPWGKTRPNYGTTAVRNFIKDNYVSWIENFRVDGFRTDSPITWDIMTAEMKVEIDR
jgi:1,4-alpha-glucan branching enzyme